MPLSRPLDCKNTLADPLAIDGWVKSNEESLKKGFVDLCRVEQQRVKIMLDLAAILGEGFPDSSCMWFSKD